MIAFAEALHLIIAAAGTLFAGIAALVAALAKRHASAAQREASQANDAVNHRHVTGTPRLYDLALRNDSRTAELITWKRGYEGGPLDSGAKVERFWREWAHMKDNVQKLTDTPPCMDPNRKGKEE